MTYFIFANKNKLQNHKMDSALFGCLEDIEFIIHNSLHILLKTSKKVGFYDRSASNGYF